MTTIYLIRHSTRINHDYINEYNTTQSELLKSEKDILSVEGEERARILAEQKEFKNVDMVYVSNCVRTLQTAKYLVEKYNLKVDIDERLDERRVGISNSDQYPDWFTRQFKDKDYKTINGESQNDVCLRMNEKINEILEKYNNKNIAIFSHGYAIMFYLLQFANLDYIDEDRIIKISYNNKILLDGKINAPEVFKLVFDGKKLVDIDHIIFKEL